jgi:branched-subunit amino acid aminotransferase/4-amino-4-deoxychorismate lyase
LPAPQTHDTRTISLKETCRVAHGSVPLWPWHRARLEAGGVDAAVLDEAERRVAEAAAGWADAATRRARLTLVVGVDGSVAVDVSQRLSSLDVPNGPLVARVDIDELPPLPQPAAKPADRTWWDAAHKRATDLGVHQAIMVDGDGLVVDGSTSAVWISREGGALVTPPAPPAIPSVSVAFIRAHAGAAGLTLRVEPVTWGQFEAAEETFLSNAFGGVVPVRGRGGPGCTAVRALLDAVWR